jgi:MinD superfamily P-loop ATPase
MPPVRFAEVNPSLCHSCGACEVACDREAIRIKEIPVGTITRYRTGAGSGILEGKLMIGSAMQTLVIRNVKKSLHSNNDILLFDAPPGTSCPVVETISGTDFVVLVTEPTPFGLNDLSIMVDLVRELDIPFGVVINKAGLGYRKVHEYLSAEGIDLIAEIPFDRSFARNYASGELITGITEGVGKAIDEVVSKICKTAKSV